MTRVVLVVLFGLSCVFFPCNGKISLPDDDDNFAVLLGGTVTIAWKIDPTLQESDLTFREWEFVTKGLPLAQIINNGNVSISNNPIFGGRVDVIKPSTLVLKNVGNNFSGKYSFLTRKGLEGYKSEVYVLVATPPVISVDCSRLTTMNTSDDFTCECRGTGGNPPANVTWYKDDEQIGFTEKEVKTLDLNNVNRTTNGTYRCEAKSHEIARNETEIELIVNYPPENVVVKLTKIGDVVSINCSAEARPSASFKIFLNETKVVASGKELTIPKVNSSHVGNYTCFASNILGEKMSAPKFLSLKGPTTQITPTPATSTISTPTASPTISSPTSKGTVPTTTPTPTPTPTPTSGPHVGLIIGIIIAVLALIVIVGVVVYCLKSKQKERNNSCANIDPVPGNGHELEEPGPSDGAYDTVWPVGTSSSKSKAPVENTLPPVYAAVDKNNPEGHTLYASLDDEALKSSRASKKEPDRPQQTEYASIDFAKSAPKAV